ncbi:MAG: RNA pseudouridine synthase [Phormidesmis priestleyi]|uniref:RNA pseudouridylate synthase n=1 Tax=Phormidesmis priestleyi TaxID=268141 RepID=A0A2W4XLH7_9CYAN|nr:MAG: RNA pseudouridine synthase [Phormidesmis priestleyi]
MNQGWTYTDRLTAAAAGQTVLDYYTQRYQHSSRRLWKDRIEQGQILLNGQPVSAQTILQSGQHLTYYRLPWQEPIAPLNFEVLYEDDDLWAIAKPSGLPVLPGGGFLEHTLLHQLRSRYPNKTPVPVHRLGRGTSGVMLVAKSQAAREHLSRQFRARTAEVEQASVKAERSLPMNLPMNQLPMEKVYRALVGPAAVSELGDHFSCTYPIGKLPYPGLNYLYGHCAGGLPSRSEGQVLDRRVESTLVEVSIFTGRPHQIRIHLAAAGYPLLGDPLYAAGGIPIVGTTAMPGDCGYHLHAHRIRFTHPRTGKPVSIVAPLPAELAINP